MTGLIKMTTQLLTQDINDLKKAGEIIRLGGLVALPTETVYGLGANALDSDAVKKIFQAKGRPQDNPLIVHISSVSEIEPLVTEIPQKARMLMDAFWPGPLTIILPKSEKVPLTTSGGLETVAVRLPSNETARKVIELAGVPIAAPSANTSGIPSPTKWEHVRDDMTGKIDAIICGDECDVGVESTVITLVSEKPRILRPGGITPEMIESVIGEVDIDDAVFAKLKQGEKAASPGMKYKHYSPKANIILVKGAIDKFADFVNSSPFESTYAMCFDGEEEKIKVGCISYGAQDDSLSQAHRLFDVLRKLDEMGAKTVFCRCPSMDGVGMAVYNRLIRACAYQVIDLDEPIVLGVTGQTGAGKGYVCEKLKKYGFSVVDTDLIAHNIVNKGSAVLTRLAEAFGKDILLDGALDRKKLAKRAFSSKDSQKLLNSITHPEIIRVSKVQMREEYAKGKTKFIIDAPLLFESTMDSLCDFTIAVTAPYQLRLERVLERDNLDEQSAARRMSVQESDEFYTSKADFSIINDGRDIDREIKNIIKIIIERSVSDGKIKG